jgi:hypothetical protein
MTVISMVPLKFSGAEMKALSVSIPGSDQRVAPVCMRDQRKVSARQREQAKRAWAAASSCADGNRHQRVWRHEVAQC